MDFQIALHDDPRPPEPPRRGVFAAALRSVAAVVATGTMLLLTLPASEIAWAQTEAGSKHAVAAAPGYALA